MKKKLLALALCLCMAFVLLPATAFAMEVSHFYVDGFLFTENDTTSQTVSLDDAPAEVTSVNFTEVSNIGSRYTVTRVGYAAFADCTGLASVSLPAVTEVDDNAFDGCTALTSVTLWQEDISFYDFSGVPASCTLYVPDSAAELFESELGWPGTVVGLWSVSGKVYDADRCAVEGAAVSVDGISVQTDEDGSYTVYVKPNQSSTITAEAPDVIDASITVSNVAGNLTGKNICATTVATPVLSLPGGNYEGSSPIAITCTTTGAAIRYTTDGSEPTASSTNYTYAFGIPSSATTTVKARAFLEGMNPSETVSATYNVFQPTGGNYTPSPVTVYNDPFVPDATVWLAGAGLASSDLLVTQRDPQGSAYTALQKLAERDDIFQTYDISLQSGKKSTGGAMRLSFNLAGTYAGQDFTLVHQKADTTYEYFYDTADAKGDLNFGPLYELSPFMLVKGTLLTSPKTADTAQPALWLGLLVLSSAGLAAGVLQAQKKRRD